MTQPDEHVEFGPQDNTVVYETWYAFAGHDHVLAVYSGQPGSSDEREFALKQAHRLWGEGRKNEQQIVAAARPGGGWYV